MYCESTAWGRASSKSSETPAHPSWISRFCGDRSEEGWREARGEIEETNIWKPGGRNMEEWMDWWRGGGGVLNWRVGDRWGARVESSASQSVTDWQSKANNSSIQWKTQTPQGFIFPCQRQLRPWPWLRRLNVFLYNLKQQFTPF